MHATQWRPVVGYEDHYEVSDQGDVRRIKPAPGARVGYALKLQIQPNGYVKVNFCVGGTVTNHWVHRVVCTAFRGEPTTEGLQACHGNGNPTDNRASNLRWGTPLENHADKILHGTRWDMTSGYCRQGHELTSENVRTNGRSGYIRCRVCSASRAREKRIADRAGRPVKVWEHGTRRFYKKGCRCDDCKAANTQYQRERLSRATKETTHG